MDIKHIRVGDVAMLKDRRGFIRVDQIVGTEIREETLGANGRVGVVHWCDAALVEKVGAFVPRDVVEEQ